MLSVTGFDPRGRGAGLLLPHADSTRQANSVAHHFTPDVFRHPPFREILTPLSCCAADAGTSPAGRFAIKRTLRRLTPGQSTLEAAPGHAVPTPRVLSVRRDYMTDLPAPVRDA